MSAIDGLFKRAINDLGRAAIALQSYRAHLVVAGGMVPLLYRRHADFAEPTIAPLATTEADVVAFPPVPRQDEGLIKQMLEDADFVVFEAPGYRHKPGAQYFQRAEHGADRLAPTYVEVLTPLRGRGESPFVDLQPGLRAQALRYLDLLAFNRFDVDVSDMVGDPCVLPVPDPAAFMLQKVLARRSGRSADKQAKDLAYVYDVVLLTRHRWPAVKASLAAIAAETHEWSRWLATARRLLTDLFAEVHSAGPVDVSRIYRDAGEVSVTEDAVFRVMSQFLKSV